MYFSYLLINVHPLVSNYDYVFQLFVNQCTPLVCYHVMYFSYLLINVPP